MFLDFYVLLDKSSWIYESVSISENQLYQTKIVGVVCVEGYTRKPSGHI